MLRVQSCVESLDELSVRHHCLFQIQVDRKVGSVGVWIAICRQVGDAGVVDSVLALENVAVAFLHQAFHRAEGVPDVDSAFAVLLRQEDFGEVRWNDVGGHHHDLFEMCCGDLGDFPLGVSVVSFGAEKVDRWRPVNVVVQDFEARFYAPQF